MPHTFGVGDVIRKARRARKWNQTRLGLEAQRFPLRAGDPKIDKSTVSKIENEPFTSEFGRVWRLIAALGLTLADVEQESGSPFLAPTASIEPQLAKLKERIQRKEANAAKTPKRRTR